MPWAEAIDLYLFIVTGAGFWGALVLMRFFSLRWHNPVMNSLMIFFALVALGLGWLMLARLLSHLSEITLLESSPLRQIVFRTVLSSGIWLLVWQVRVRRIG